MSQDEFTETQELLDDFAELSKKIDLANIIAVFEMTNKQAQDNKED